MSTDHTIPESLPVIDESRLLADFGDTPEIIAELRDLFLAHIPPLVESITAGADAGDAPELARQAHSLKGACSTYGAPRLVAVCRDLEVLGHQGDLAAIARRLPDFAAEIDAFVRQLGAVTAP